MSNPLKILYNKFFPSVIQTQNNNIDSQTFDPNLTHNVSMISGFDGTHENLAIVDTSGNLHVNSAASSYLHSYVFYGNITTGYQSVVNIAFPTPVSLVFLSNGTNNAQMAFVDTTTGQLGNFCVLGPGLYTLPLVTSGIAFYANTSGNIVYYSIIGYY